LETAGPAWSAAARVLVDPPGTFRALVAAGGRGSMWRGPARLLAVFGATVSLLASGRLSVRLIADGMVSFGFVPLIELAALAVVSRTRVGRAPAPRLPFAREVALYCSGHTPWLLWMTAVGAWFAGQPSRADGRWFWPAMAAAAIAAAWSAWIDYHFLREVLRHDARRARRALAVNRGVGWGLGIGVFLGIAIWSQYEPVVAGWLGGAR